MADNAPIVQEPEIVHTVTNHPNKLTTMVKIDTTDKTLVFGDRTLASLNNTKAAPPVMSHNLWLWMKKRNTEERRTAFFFRLIRGDEEKPVLSVGFFWRGVPGMLRYSTVRSICHDGGAASAFPVTGPNVEDRVIKIVGGWDAYTNNGICFLDQEHNMYWGFARWEANDNTGTRKCRNCGLVQFKAIKYKLEKREEWHETRQDAEAVELDSLVSVKQQSHEALNKLLR